MLDQHHTWLKIAVWGGGGGEHTGPILHWVEDSSMGTHTGPTSDWVEDSSMGTHWTNTTLG